MEKTVSFKHMCNHFVLFSRFLSYQRKFFLGTYGPCVINRFRVLLISKIFFSFGQKHKWNSRPIVLLLITRQRQNYRFNYDTRKSTINRHVCRDLKKNFRESFSSSYRSSLRRYTRTSAIKPLMLFSTT